LGEIEIFRGEVFERCLRCHNYMTEVLRKQKTQMTLNSVDWEEYITIQKDNGCEDIKIGQLIDKLLKENISDVQYLGDNKDNEMGNVQYLDINKYNMSIYSVNEYGIVSLEKITAVTKHLPINKDGTNTLVCVTTNTGKCVTATKGKSFLTWNNDRLIITRGDELIIGMHLPVLENGNNKAIREEIVSIIEVQPSNTYVYDLTVENTKTFVLTNNIFCMDSFHHSGIASMSATVQGVPRMKELLSVSKKPKTPQMVIYLTQEYLGSKDMAHKIGSHIKHTTLSDIRGRINVYYDPNPKAKDSIMEKDNVKHIFFQHKGTKTGCQSEITGLPWLMRIELDREKMLDKEVTLLEIKTKFCSWWEKRFAESKSMKKEEKKVLNKITQIAVLSNSDNDKQPVIHLRFNVKDADRDKDKFDTNTIDNFIDFIIDKFKLKGIASISDIPAIQEERILTFDKNSGKLERNAQYVIYATGVNFNDVRYLTGIDLNKTISNHVMEVYYTFGIEIARAVLLREVANAYERAGGEVNYQHVTMIVDQMTATGTINSIDRHGMNKSDSDPLSRASFEKTVEQLLIASVYGETDYMKGISSRVMVGAVIKGGTGYCELELDTDMIEKSEYIENIDYNKKFTELNKGTLAVDIINKKNDDIFVPL
jgi:DNA-directed RNA polymerase beta' subunit